MWMIHVGSGFIRSVFSMLSSVSVAGDRAGRQRPAFGPNPRNAVEVGVRVPPKVTLQVAPRVGFRVAMRFWLLTD
jgi:hypothetical protein